MLCIPVTPLQGAERSFRSIAAVDDAAPGSGSVDGRPDGVFAYAQNVFEFGTPSAGTGGFSAFRAAARLVQQPQLPDTRQGAWSAGPGGLSVYILTGMPAPGTTGTFIGVDGEGTMNEAGEVAFWTSWSRPSPPDGGVGIWWGKAGAGAPSTLELVTSRYEDRRTDDAILLVKDTLTMYGGAEWLGKLDLESDASELRLDSAPGPRQTYTLHSAVDKPGDEQSSVIVRNAALRLAKGKAFLPAVTLEENSRLMNHLPVAPSTNKSEFIIMRRINWNGGTIGGSPPSERTLILLAGRLTVEGTGEHLLDAVMEVDEVRQRGPVTIAGGGAWRLIASIPSTRAGRSSHR